MTDLFDYQSNNNTAPPKDKAKEPPKSNVPEFSVGDLAMSLKRTLEDNFGRVRVRGELSRVSIAGSGHMYTSLKDDQALIDAVCWKGNMNKLSIRPEEGLEVICTGRISSYPKSSKYQLIIESMELAGEGALLKMLEERKKKLAAEGLFSEERKKRLPFVPNVIGVVTSPTGAVIRDILHRLSDRFPRHVLVWPVLVQGDGAADQVSNAIRGFDQMQDGGPMPRPDLLIVARGGGSLEDLMAFNEENVVRAVADCSIPVISAVGHETDTTLCDFVADLRAPTPTAAAEMAVPHRRDLMAQILDDEKRLLSGLNRLHNEWRHKLDAQSARLGDPSKLLETKQQNIDFLGDKITTTFRSFIQTKGMNLQNIAARLLSPAALLDNKMQTLNNTFDKTQQIFKNYIQGKESYIQQTSAKLVDPKHAINQSAQKLENWSQRLEQTVPRLTEKKQDALKSAERMLETLSYQGTLKRGYVVVRDSNDTPITDPSNMDANQDYDLEFADDKRVSVSTKN